MLQDIYRRSKMTFVPTRQDFRNIIRYGFKAPIAGERIWIDPVAVRRIVAPHPAELGIEPHQPEFHEMIKALRRVRSSIGHVIGDELDEYDCRPLWSLRKMRACRAHWENGLSWEETGAIDDMMFKIHASKAMMSECRDRDDVKRRYQRLDELFNRLKADGTLESFATRKRGFLRETDGVQIHLGRDGELLFGETGTHRLAMALLLGFDCIPATLGFVHKSSLDYLPHLRRRSRRSETRQPALTDHGLDGDPVRPAKRRKSAR